MYVKMVLKTISSQLILEKMRLENTKLKLPQYIFNFFNMIVVKLVSVLEPSVTSDVQLWFFVSGNKPDLVSLVKSKSHIQKYYICRDMERSQIAKLNVYNGTVHCVPCKMRQPGSSERSKQAGYPQACKHHHCRQTAHHQPPPPPPTPPPTPRTTHPAEPRATTTSSTSHQDERQRLYVNLV